MQTMANIIERIKQDYDENPDWGVYDGVLSRGEIKEILNLFATIQSQSQSNLNEKPSSIKNGLPTASPDSTLDLADSQYKNAVFVQNSKCQFVDFVKSENAESAQIPLHAQSSGENPTFTIDAFDCFMQDAFGMKRVVKTGNENAPR